MMLLVGLEVFVSVEFRLWGFGLGLEAYWGVGLQFI